MAFGYDSGLKPWVLREFWVLGFGAMGAFANGNPILRGPFSLVQGFNTYAIKSSNISLDKLSKKGCPYGEIYPGHYLRQIKE
jgi:hypothetical protein